MYPRFEKVSYEQFYDAMSEIIDTEYKDEFIKSAYESLSIPQRATKGSAGYDFKAPFTFTLEPSKEIKIPTGIRCYMPENMVLFIFPRSGLGTKNRLQLNNTTGIVDSDYYYSSNEGHIMATLINDSRTNKTLTVEAGKGFCQGIFLNYFTTADDSSNGIRDGGFGSTDGNIV